VGDAAPKSVTPGFAVLFMVVGLLMLAWVVGLNIGELSIVGDVVRMVSDVVRIAVVVLAVVDISVM